MAQTANTQYTSIDKQNILDAMDLAIASAKRAHNSAKQREFKELYDKRISELNALRVKIEQQTQ